MAEGDRGRAQGPLAQHGAMGVHQRKGGVVADGPDVAEMVGEPLQFRHQAAQPMRARGRLETQRGLDRAREGDAVGDRRVATDARGEDGGAVDTRAAHQGVDALVDIAEPLFEPHHRLAAGVEAEVARLDDPRVDGTDRYLVQSRPLHGEEGVGVRRAVMRDRSPERMAHAPSAMIEPGPGVWSAGRDESKKIAGRALETPGRSMDRRDRGKGAAVTGEIENLQRSAGPDQRHAHLALVAPEARERRGIRSQAVRGGPPILSGNERRLANRRRHAFLV